MIVIHFVVIIRFRICGKQTSEKKFKLPNKKVIVGLAELAFVNVNKI